MQRILDGLAHLAKWGLIGVVTTFLTSPFWYPLLPHPADSGSPDSDVALTISCSPDPCRIGRVFQQGMELKPYFGNYSARSGWSEWSIEVDGVMVTQRVDVPVGEVYGWVHRTEGFISMTN